MDLLESAVSESELVLLVTDSKRRGSSYLEQWFLQKYQNKPNLVVFSEELANIPNKQFNEFEQIVNWLDLINIKKVQYQHHIFQLEQSNESKIKSLENELNQQNKQLKQIDEFKANLVNLMERTNDALERDFEQWYDQESVQLMNEQLIDYFKQTHYWGIGFVWSLLGNMSFQIEQLLQHPFKKAELGVYYSAGRFNESLFHLLNQLEIYMKTLSEKTDLNLMKLLEQIQWQKNDTNSYLNPELLRYQIKKSSSGVYDALISKFQQQVDQLTVVMISSLFGSTVAGGLSMHFALTVEYCGLSTIGLYALVLYLSKLRLKGYQKGFMQQIQTINKTIRFNTTKSYQTEFQRLMNRPLSNAMHQLILTTQEKRNNMMDVLKEVNAQSRQLEQLKERIDKL